MSQSGVVASLAQDSAHSTDQDRLALPWTRCMREPSLRDYLLGPGDQLEIAVTSMEEFSPSPVIRV